MYKFQIFIRTAPVEKNALYPFCCIKQAYLNKSTKSSSSSSSESDNEKKSKVLDRKKRSDESLNKLNSLLRKLVEEDIVRSSAKLNLAKPTNKRIIKETEQDSTKTDSVPKQMVNAVKDVAQTIGGDVKQTESELLLKLLSPIESTPAINLSDVVKGMKIDRDSKPAEHSRGDQVRSLLQKVKYKSASREGAQTERNQRRPLEQKRKPQIVVQKIDLFGTEPLGIFTSKDLKDSPENNTWQYLYERDLKLAVTHPPANYFQQMILWTEQGKLWKFPIDNEQGLEEESKVYFAKHVFLEEHLDPWCPPKGPLRHFMELVCVGLSKNPYLTVDAKREHINWYKDYFEDKKKILQEVGVLSIETKPQKSLE